MMPHWAPQDNFLIAKLPNEWMAPRRLPEAENNRALDGWELDGENICNYPKIARLSGQWSIVESENLSRNIEPELDGFMMFHVKRDPIRGSTMDIKIDSSLKYPRPSLDAPPHIRHHEIFRYSGFPDHMILFYK